MLSNYIVAHETPGTAQELDTRCRQAMGQFKGGQESVGGGARRKRVGEFDFPLGPDLPSEGCARATAATHS
jgi:hypothetical protein